MNNENVLLIAPAPGAEKDMGVIGSDEIVIMAETISTVLSICFCSCSDFPCFRIPKISVISSDENRIPFRLADIMSDISIGGNDLLLFPSTCAAAVLISSIFNGSMF